MANPFSSDPLFPEVSDIPAGEWFTEEQLDAMKLAQHLNNARRIAPHLPKLRLRYAISHFWYLSPSYRDQLMLHTKKQTSGDFLNAWISDGTITTNDCIFKTVWLDTPESCYSSPNVYLSFRAPYPRTEIGCYVLISLTNYTKDNPQPLLTLPKNWLYHAASSWIEEDFYNEAALQNELTGD